MRYCSNCGKELNPGQDVCLNCGRSVNSIKSNSSMLDTGGTGWIVLGLFLPIVGLVLFLVWNASQPLNAKAAGKGALIGVVLYFVFSLITTARFLGRI